MTLGQDFGNAKGHNKTAVAIIMVAILVAILMIAGCNKEGTGSNSTPVEVKNPALKAEISRLQQDMETRNLTGADTAKVLELSKDPVEKFYAKEFEWLVKHNEYDHLNHPLTFLDWYERTGVETFCAPHELGHLASYIKNGDIAFAEETYAVVRQKRHLWDEKEAINEQKYPQFYTLVSTELVPKMDQAMGLLDKKDYGNETLALLEEIDLKSVC